MTRISGRLITSLHKLLNEQKVSVRGLNCLKALVNALFTIASLLLLLKVTILSAFFNITHAVINKIIFVTHIMVLFCIVGAYT